MTDLPASAALSSPDKTGGVEKTAADAIDTRVVRKLADILRASDLTSIEVERGDLRIRVAREGSAAPVYAAPPQAPAPAAASSPAAPTGAAPIEATAPPARRESDLVKSPMVGTIYLQPQPGAAPFVKLNDRVTAGQTLFVVEAMKTMNPIAAAKDGVLLELLIGDAQPVEFGQPLAVIA